MRKIRERKMEIINEQLNSLKFIRIKLKFKIIKFIK